MFEQVGAREELTGRHRKGRTPQEPRSTGRHELGDELGRRAGHDGRDQDGPGRLSQIAATARLRPRKVPWGASRTPACTSTTAEVSVAS